MGGSTTNEFLAFQLLSQSFLRRLPSSLSVREGESESSPPWTTKYQEEYWWIAAKSKDKAREKGRRESWVDISTEIKTNTRDKTNSVVQYSQKFFRGLWGDSTSFNVGKHSVRCETQWLNCFRGWESWTWTFIGISFLKDKYQAFVSWIGGIFFILWNHDTWWLCFWWNSLENRSLISCWWSLSHVFSSWWGALSEHRWRGRQNEIEVVSRFVEQVNTKF